MKRILLATSVFGLLIGQTPARAEAPDAAASLPDPSQIEIISVRPRSADVKPIIASIPVMNGDRVLARNTDSSSASDRRADDAAPKSGT